MAGALLRPRPRVIADLLSAAGLDERRAPVPVERMLAVARVILAGVSLFAVHIDDPERGDPLAPAYALLAGYSVHSLTFLLLLWRRPGLGGPLGKPLHAADVAVAAALTFISEGPNSPFFPLFVLVVVGAAYRWGLRATLVTAVWIAALLVIQTIALATLGTAPDALEVDRLIIRCTYLLLVAYLVGYLAEREKTLRAEASAAGRLAGMARLDRGLSRSLQEVMRHLLRIAGGARAVLLFREGASGRAYRWATDAATDSGSAGWRELPPGQREQSFGVWPPDVELLRIAPGGRAAAGILALDTRHHEVDVEADALAGLPWTDGEPPAAVVCLPFRFPDGSEARLCFEGGQVGHHPAPVLALLQRLVRHVFPALFNLYVVRRLRARAGALERARVARELHDGVIQSLIGLEMQIDVARRGAPAGLGDVLGGIQARLHDEVLNVRDLMHQLRPVPAEAGTLVEALSGIVDRFRRDTGLEAQFVPVVEEVVVPDRTAREVTRILQEALVNVRKHSGASSVVVRLASAAGGWLLSVDDDGRGFDFEGRLEQAELDSARRGPVVIKERVRAIGGRIAIESTPGRGSRLEVLVPGEVDV